MPELLSIGACLDAAAARLAAAGHPQPRREARALWAALARQSTGDVWLTQDASAAPSAVDRFQDAVARRCDGVPFAYTVGCVTFRTLELALDPRALIPRPETEGLVELALGAARAGRPGGYAADIGTGCGCIALSLAVEGDFAGIVAVDRDASAATLARSNVARVSPRVPVEIRVGDLLAPLSGERYRAIVSNPPYLTEDEVAALDPAVRSFEPRAALDGGPDGLAPTRRLLAEGHTLLVPGGLLALEIDERRAPLVVALAHDHGWRRVTIHEDLFGRPRYALAYREAR